MRDCAALLATEPSTINNYVTLQIRHAGKRNSTSKSGSSRSKPSLNLPPLVPPGGGPQAPDLSDCLGIYRRTVLTMITIVGSA